MSTFQAWRAKLRAHLVADCTVMHKLWSVWATVAAGALNEAVDYWPHFPDDLKQYLPHLLVVWMARLSFPAIIIARAMRQKSLGDRP